MQEDGQHTAFTTEHMVEGNPADILLHVRTWKGEKPARYRHHTPWIDCRGGRRSCKKCRIWSHFLCQAADADDAGTSGVATGGSRGRVPPLTEKICQKSGKRGKKSGKGGNKRKNREVSSTLSLLTYRAGYATGRYWGILLSDIIGKQRLKLTFTC